MINVVRNRGYEVVYIRFGIVRLGLLRSTNTIQANEKYRGKKKKKKKKKISPTRYGGNFCFPAARDILATRDPVTCDPLFSVDILSYPK